MIKYLFITALGCFMSLGVFGQSDLGCTDPQAGNYNPLAQFDDGSCCYENWITLNSSFFPDYAASCYVYSTNLSYSVYPDANGMLSFCLPEGCYYLYVYVSSALPGEIEVVNNGNVLSTIAITEWSQGYGEVAFELGTTLGGCMDPNACNYNANATCDDGTCSYDCYGCTDPQAPNFNPLATVDDGSCCENGNYLAVQINGLPQWYGIYLNDGNGFLNQYLENGQFNCYADGCYQISITLYDSTEVFDYQLLNFDGDIVSSGTFSLQNQAFSFALNSTSGCNDPGACNFDPSATCNDGSCTYDCYGCTDPDAINYDADAILDDGSCCTNSYSFNADGSFYWSVTSAQNGAFLHTGMYPESNSFCLNDGCFNIQFYLVPDPLDSINTPVNWTLTDGQGNIAVSGVITDFSNPAYFTNNAISGCDNPWACNYNPDANCADNSLCVYDCYGCTDPEAGNYDPEAQFDDGSCCTGAWYTVQTSTPGYWNVWANSGLFGSYGFAPDQTGFCKSGDGCLTVSFYPADQTVQNYSIQVFDENNNLIGEFSGVPEYGYAYGQILDGSISGCMDPGACNYDPLANCPDYGLCTYDCFGCTDPNAPNYNPEATIDNGTCCTNAWYTIQFNQPAWWSVYSNVDGNYSAGSYPEQNGFCVGEACFQVSAWSYDGTELTYSIFNENNELVSEGTISVYDYGVSVALGQYEAGCGDLYACNYNPNANCWDYTACDYSCFGCTDPQAPNYSPNATIDNGTCCTNGWFNVNSNGVGYWYAYNQQFEYAYGITNETTGFCMSSSCFAFTFYNFGSEEVSFTISDAEGNIILEGVAEPGQYNLFSVSSDANEVAGCTDANACNYNADATCDDGSCNTYCGGCTDPEAFNYNANALYDDGSCLYQLMAPDMGMTMIPDYDNNQYFISVSMMSQGNGAPYVLSSDYNNDMLMLNDEGQYIAGPYPCDAEIEFVLQSLPAGMATYLEASLEGECAVANDLNELEILPVLSVYPNPSNGLFTIAGIKTNDAKVEIEIFDLQGRSLYRKQSNVSNGVINLERLSLADGVYQVIATTSEAISTARIVVRN